MFKKLRKRRKKKQQQQHGPEPSASSPSQTKPLWLPSKVQGIVYSLRAQQKEWRTNQSLVARWNRYSPSPLRRLKRLFSTNSEPNLSDSDSAQRLSEDEWDAGTLQHEESSKDLDEIGSFEGLKSSCEEICTSCDEQQGSVEEKFHWVDSSTSLKLKEPYKHYYVLTPEIAQQSDTSSGDLTVQFHHDYSCETSSMMIQKDQEPAQNTSDDKSLLQDSVHGLLSNTKISEEKCLPVLDLEANCTSVVRDNMPIVIENKEKDFENNPHQFHSENCVPVTKASAACSNDVHVVPPPIYSMVPPSIVLQQPEQLTILELSPARPSIGRLHLKADVSDVGARKSPVTVQEWVDSLPLEVPRGDEDNEELQHHEPDELLDLGLGAEAGLFAVVPELEVSSADDGSVCKKIKQKEGFVREPSFQSDITSHTGSSMESYLESRRADPEEVLLSLGFGGTGGGLQSDVSRIPQRFLQPSQVKGVAVDDFLQYQQDLIEKFESGFSGYRGLVGPSHTPSVIVAKIMEKLRDHERESSCRSSVISHPSVSMPASIPPPQEPKKFSHVARRVMKRTSVASALSVLNPANREYLNSQGSKSPDIPRKRMIIGQRSFTFSGDGDLIEVESCPSSPLTPCTPLMKGERMPAKRLVHKDSVLSMATSASMTSIDSDSDTDDRSSDCEAHNGITRNPSTLPRFDICPALPVANTTFVQGNHHNRGLNKRLSSTSLSSWEMESSAQQHEPLNNISASGLACVNVEEVSLKMRTNFSSLNFARAKCESIDEDVTMEAQSEPRSILKSSSLVEKFESGSDVELGMEASEELCDSPYHLTNDSVVLDPPTSRQQPQTPTCLVRDQVCMLHRDRSSRRGSLKRQQHIVEDGDYIDNAEDKSMDTTPMQEVFTPLLTLSNDQGLLPLIPDTKVDSFEMEEVLPLDEERDLLHLVRARSESSGFLEGDITENIPSSNCSPKSHSMTSDQALGTLESCQSTSDYGADSGAVSESVMDVVAAHKDVFTQDRQSSDVMLTRQHEDADLQVKQSVDVGCKSGLNDIVSCDGSSFPFNQVPAEESDVWSILGIWGNDKYMKRLSLPVVCVHDEMGNMSRLSTSSSRSCSSDDGSTVTCSVRRVRSAPQSLCDAGELHTTTIQACGSFSNMFSFCSDESVIHISSRKGGTKSCACRHISSPNSRRHSASFDNLNSGHCRSRYGYPELRSGNFQLAGEKHEPTKHSTKDLQELIHELTARGLELGKYLDIHNACHSESQQAHLHASTLRLAVESYKKQLSYGTELPLAGLNDCAEAQQELEVTRNICSRITAELRHIADLLEEEPTIKVANVTCQMTELLREQTRLYEQLTSRGSGVSVTQPPDVVSLNSSLKPKVYVPHSDHCCCSKQIIRVVKEEHGRLEQLIKKNTDELTEIRHLLCELLSKNSDSQPLT